MINQDLSRKSPQKRMKSTNNRKWRNSYGQRDHALQKERRKQQRNGIYKEVLALSAGYRENPRYSFLWRLISLVEGSKKVLLPLDPLRNEEPKDWCDRGRKRKDLQGGKRFLSLFFALAFEFYQNSRSLLPFPSIQWSSNWGLEDISARTKRERRQLGPLGQVISPQFDGMW